MTILCDVDGVVADMLPAWLELYNADYGDSLTVADITQWDVSLFVKLECGKRVFEYLHRPELYQRTEPIRGAVAGIRTLREMGHRVILLTACVGPEMAKAKTEWLNEYGLANGLSDVILTGTNPELKGMMQADVMLDDYEKNLEAFGGYGILFDAPYNRHDSIHQRAGNWSDILELLGEP